MKIVVNTMKSLLIVSLIIAILFLGTLLWITNQFPNDTHITDCMTTKLYNVYLCPTNSNYVRLNKISTYLQKSVVLTEDSSFWDHHGFDIVELKNSLEKNMRTGRFARGGSTITQQLAKNMFLTKDKTISRKLKEAIIAFRLEKKLKKKEILEKYFNIVQFGKNIFGIKRASEFYFKKQPEELSLVESAFLTFLLPSPEKYSLSFLDGEISPFTRKRMNQIIDNLYLYERINEEEFFSAKKELDGFMVAEESDEPKTHSYNEEQDDEDDN